MQRTVANAVRFLRRNGTRRFVAHVVERVQETFHERYLNIDTAGGVAVALLGGPDESYYSPISYAAFAAAMRRIRSTPDDVFVDYGAGKGRVVVLAATYPFRRVTGVEFVPALAEQARENIARAAYRLRCPDVQVIVADAARLPVADDATVLHFFNPFRGATLDAVIRHLRESLARRPREVTVLYANPDDFERALAERLLDPAWIRAREELTFPRKPRVGPHGNSYRIYRLDSRHAVRAASAAP